MEHCEARTTGSHDVNIPSYVMVILFIRSFVRNFDGNSRMQQAEQLLRGPSVVCRLANCTAI